ncbi:MAG: flavodoxin family protein [Chloroflexi bacterium]|nr:flavodoxin family protein [Chloroflexota bacterium]
MHVLIIESSPNRDGLTAACAQAAIRGVEAAGGTAEDVRLKDLRIASCNQCSDGWGGCRPNHRCGGVQDDFQALHERAIAADALALVTPVYWGDLSEAMKNFTDRMRRCEATLGEESRLAGKPVLLVAAAGGSGNGLISCLTNMERWAQHVRALPFDLIGIKRITRAYKLETIRAAGEALARYPG